MAGVMGGEKTPTVPATRPRRGALAPLFMAARFFCLWQKKLDGHRWTQMSFLF